MKNQYDKIATWFDEHRNRELFEKKYLDLIRGELHGDGSILDLGCGMGEPIAQYFLDNGFHVIGVDSSQKLLDIARKRFPKTTFICQDMTKINFNKEFDCIIAWHSFFHLEREKQKQMFPLFLEHLRPGGILVFTSGVENGEVWSKNGGENLYHASLSEDEYKSLANANHFDLILHKLQDPEWGGQQFGVLKRKSSFN